MRHAALILFLFFLFNIKGQGLQPVETVYHYDAHDSLISVELILKLPVNRDSMVLLEQDDIERFKREETFSIGRFGGYDFSRHLIVNNDTIRIESDYERIHFNSVNKPKKYLVRKGTSWYFEVRVYSPGLVNKKEFSGKDKKVLLRIFSADRSPILERGYTIKDRNDK
jgi:hypothetical protein